MPDIQLYVNGLIYSGWKTATITRSLDAIAGKFELSTTDRWDAKRERWTIFPGDTCVLKVDGETLITGYVDSASPSYTSTSHDISIAGRDKTCDVVDCSVNVSQITGKTLAGIAKALAEPYGISVLTEIDTGAVFNSFALQPGETCWEAIDRAAKQRFMAVTTDGNGNLLIGKIAEKEATDELREGVNILSASAAYDNTNRFKHYKVLGQSSVAELGTEAARQAVVSTATDANVSRFRLKVLTAETEATDGSSQKRAEQEAALRAANSTKVQVQVQGWRQSDGALWPLNALVKIHSPMLSVSEKLLITSVQFGVSSGEGFTTNMELSRPDAYLFARTKKIKKGRQESGVRNDPYRDFESDD